MREMELRGERCRVRLARENMEEDGRGMEGNSLPLFGISSFRTAQSSMASQCTEWPKCPDTGRPHLKSRHGDRTASPRSCHAGTLRATLTPRTPQVPGNGDLGSASCDVSRPRTNSVHDTHPIHDGRQIAARPPIEAGPPHCGRDSPAGRAGETPDSRGGRSLQSICFSPTCSSPGQGKSRILYLFLFFLIPRLEERLDGVSEC